MVAFVANTNILELIGLQDALTEAYVNDATVSITTIEDEDGVGVYPTSGSPISMSYVTGSDGDYRGVVGAELPLVAGTCYVAHIDVDAGVDRIAHYEFRFVALRRTNR